MAEEGVVAWRGPGESRKFSPVNRKNGFSQSDTHLKLGVSRNDVSVTTKGSKRYSIIISRACAPLRLLRPALTASRVGRPVARARRPPSRGAPVKFAWEFACNELFCRGSKTKSWQMPSPRTLTRTPRALFVLRFTPSELCGCGARCRQGSGCPCALSL